MDSIILEKEGIKFPQWILDHFSKYKLPEFMRTENDDPCAVEKKINLRLYQEFLGEYLGPTTHYREILIYHGLGSGKTVTAINLFNIYYNLDPDLNIIILIKAALRDDPWMKDLRNWLNSSNPTPEEHQRRMNVIHFVHYDAPNAEKSFDNVMKTIDPTKHNMFVIDEVHNFIRNVYSNLKTEGRRAYNIYNKIRQIKKRDKSTHIIAISGTPAINVPFELSLLFNLLRPGIFPQNETEFNRIFISDSAYPILKPSSRNLFERRILGLVSYYIGATPDLFAKQITQTMQLTMSNYQYNVYRVFEKYEQEVEAKARARGYKSPLFRTFTRQACNFVFPYVNTQINGESRPRPRQFGLNEKEGERIDEAKTGDLKSSQNAEKMRAYRDAVSVFLTATEKYFNEIKQSDQSADRNIQDDLNDFGPIHDFNRFLETGPKSRLFNELYQCSPKMLAIVFYTYHAPGKVLIYSNYVNIEGLDMLKIYLKLIGFNDYTRTQREFMGYTEYHGGIDPKDRKKIRTQFNAEDNVTGSKCKVILLSPSATEGIELTNIREEHILEPYWTEVRIQQVIGRGIRQCSHKELPQAQRIVNIYRYVVVKPEELLPGDNTILSTDQHIEAQAKTKANLIESFTSAMKEAAVDCELFKSHNMLSQNYHCFQFSSSNVSGPAYKKDINEDIKYDIGLHSAQTHVESVRVIKIQGVTKVGYGAGGNPQYSEPKTYWLSLSGPTANTVYDEHTHFPVGRIELVQNSVPNKINDNTYVVLLQ